MKTIFKITTLIALFAISTTFGKTLNELTDQYPMNDEKSSREYIIANADDFAKEFNKWKDINIPAEIKGNPKAFRAFAHYYVLYTPACSDVVGIQLSAPGWCAKATPNKLKQLKENKYVIKGVKFTDTKILMVGIYSNDIEIINDCNFDKVELKIVEKFLPDIKACLLKSTDATKAYNIYCKIETKLCIEESSKLESFTVIRSILLNRKLINN